MSREWIISSRRAKSYPLNRLVRAQEAKETLLFEEVDYQGTLSSAAQKMFGSHQIARTQLTLQTEQSYLKKVSHLVLRKSGLRHKLFLSLEAFTPTEIQRKLTR